MLDSDAPAQLHKDQFQVCCTRRLWNQHAITWVQNGLQHGPSFMTKNPTALALKSFTLDSRLGKTLPAWTTCRMKFYISALGAERVSNDLLRSHGLAPA